MGLSPVFLRLWLGQLISNLGTQISLFGLGLWLFKSDGQLGSFALVAVVVQLSRLAVTRLLVRRLERWPRRRVMVGANVVGACGTLGLAAWISAAGGTLTTIQVLPFLAIASAAEATQVMSFSTLVVKLVPALQRATAGGLFATSEGFAALLAPLLGALLVAWTGLRGVVILDCSSFLIAFACLAIGRWPRGALVPSSPSDRAPSSPSAGLRHVYPILWDQFYLRHLLFLGAALMLVFAAAEIIFPAWVLGLQNGRLRLAVALGLSALAYAAGLVLWRFLARRPRLWPRVFVSCLFCQSVVLLGASIPDVYDHPFLWYGGVTIFNFAVPLELASQQSLWQSWVSHDGQPRVFAARYAIDWSARFVAVASVGPLVDYFLVNLEPGVGGSPPMSKALALLGSLLLLSILIFWRLVQAKVDQVCKISA